MQLQARELFFLGGGFVEKIGGEMLTKSNKKNPEFDKCLHVLNEPRLRSWWWRGLLLRGPVSPLGGAACAQRVSEVTKVIKAR